VLTDALNTHYLSVKNRVLAINSARQFLGIMSAQDWPPKDVILEAFYLLTLGEVPLGRQADSAAVPVYVHTAQWTWLILGTDVQVGIQTRSRGSRYQTQFQMKQELLNGTYPRFAQKLDVTVDGNGNLVATPITNPSDYIVWAPPSFVDRNEKGSGVMYGTATVRITDMTDTIS
jgi:hypothetical protein